MLRPSIGGADFLGRGRTGKQKQEGGAGDAHICGTCQKYIVCLFGVQLSEN
jgi:hypothetical protein